MQTKLESFIETVLSTAIGYVVSLFVWPIAGWLFSFEYSHIHPFGTTAIFTVASLIRGYAIRRWCERYLKRFSTWLAAKIQKGRIKMRTLRALAVNALYITLLILGMVYAVKGAENIVVFWTILSGILSPFMATEDVVRTYAKSKRRLMPYLHVTVSVLAILAFIWFGWVWCAIAKIVSVFCFLMMVELSKKYKDAIDKSVSTQ